MKIRLVVVMGKTISAGLQMASHAIGDQYP
jgi:hypothetical protein